MAHQRQHLAGTGGKAHLLQHRLLAIVGEAHPLEADPPLQRRALPLRALPGFVQQGKDSLPRHHGLLQLVELVGHLDEGLDHSPQIADEGVEHPHLDGAACAQPLVGKQGEQADEHHHVEEIDEGAQQYAVDLEALDPGLPVLLVHLGKGIGEVVLLHHGLNDRHPLQGLVEPAVDVGEQAAGRPHHGYAQFLVEPHHGPHRRQQGGAHQHQAQIQQRHGDEDAAQEHHFLHQQPYHLDIEVHDRLCVVGDAGDEGARAVLVEIAGRQPDGGGKHLLAKALHHRLGDAVEAQGLQVETRRREHLQAEITGGKGGDVGPHQLARRQIVVDEEFDEQGPGHFGAGGQQQADARLHQPAGIAGAIGEQPFDGRVHRLASSTALSGN
ncbi:hypothetical protein D3C85_995490 [compost metagenome]